MQTEAMKEGLKIENEFRHKIANKNILVVGDIMLDRYVCGEVDRISPEAPVPVVRITDEYDILGGSGNVVRNLVELGANVTCAGAVGNDTAGRIIVNELEKFGVKSELVILDDVPTIQKTRIIATSGHIQMLRVDKEKVKSVTHKFLLKNSYDVIVVSDYGKGMVTAQLMSSLKKMDVPIIVDPKPQNMWLYSDVFMITPNKKEYDEICMSSQHPFAQGIRYVLRTLGKDGMELMNKKVRFSIPTIPVDVFNVSGAGDTVVAIMAACMSINIDIEIAAKIANVCAGYVVTKPDTSVVPSKKFYKALYSFTLGEING